VGTSGADRWVSVTDRLPSAWCSLSPSGGLRLGLGNGSQGWRGCARFGLDGRIFCIVSAHTLALRLSSGCFTLVFLVIEAHGGMNVDSVPEGSLCRSLGGIVCLGGYSESGLQMGQGLKL